MGSMAFRLPADVSSDAERELERACVAGGQDGMPYLTQISVENGLLQVRRSVDESGFLQVPWKLDDVGRLMFTSATLMERPLPYHLLLELARGKVHQLRNQTSDWTQGGLILHESVRQRVHDAAFAFGKAAAHSNSPNVDAEAAKALMLGLHASNELVETYTEQVFQVRHARHAHLDTTWGCQVSAIPARSELFHETFNAIKLPISWQALEPTEDQWTWEHLDRLVDFATSQGKTVIGGPLIDFSGRAVADWLWSRQPDLNELSRWLTGYLEAVIGRYKDRIRVWQLTAASNWSGVLATNDEELLWLTVRLLEVVRKIDPGLEIHIGLAQPWGEYLSGEEHNVTPFSYADTLLRTGARIDGLDLEMVMGVWPRGSYCRDPLELSRLLDLYVLLGIPLYLTLGYPSATTPDVLADEGLRPDGGSWAGDHSPRTQADWTRAFGRLALCKPFVRGVSWAHWNDAIAHHFPHCGVLDAQGEPKPGLDELRKLRAEHLR
jgi:hypothetical protein